MKYKISIIIPIYNQEKYLDQTLSSLINQTIGIENIEVIMVNDCSTDGTAKIIKKYATKYENFINIRLTENCGLPGRPRNIGIDRATGEYIMFMDHDDYYEEDAFETLYNKITKENVDITFCNFKNVFENGTTQNNITIYGDKEEIKLKTVQNDKRVLSLSPSIWTKIFKRSFIIGNNIRFPEGILAEDLSFFIHTLLKANGIVCLNNYYGYNYRILNSKATKSTIHVRSKKYLHAMILGYLDTYNILKKEKKENYFPTIFEGHLEYWMNCFVTGNTTKTEKKELLEEAVFLFEKQSEYGFKADKSCLELFNKIKNKEFDDAILISELSSIFKKKELSLTNSYRRLEQDNQNLKNQLNSKKKQVADLQSVKGWSSYKTKNIMSRVKNKIRN